MLTTRSIKFISLFIACLVLGVLLGNLVVLTVSLVPLSLIILGIVTESPGNVTISNKSVPSRVWKGDVVEIKYEVMVRSGVGIISLFQELPPYFALVEGNNLRVFWKGWQQQAFTFACKVRCTKRGIYELPALRWEGNHALRLTQTQEGNLGEPAVLTVRPRPLNVRRIRGLPGIATSPYPVVDIARIGVPTTDFREIRDYVYGDPVKNINWKATARSASSQQKPLTNEYEVEGKKAVWLFLDASAVMEVGTDIENAFEYCLEAANSVVYYYLNLGYRVGMYVFNDGKRLFYPDAGKKQFLKISRELLGIKTVEMYDEFPFAIEKCRRYILGYKPLCIIVTRLDARHSDSIVQGIKVLRQLLGHRRRKLPVMLISVGGYNVIPSNEEYDENTKMLIQLDTRPRIRQLRRLDISVLDWNPQKENFGTALLKQIKTR